MISASGEVEAAIIEMTGWYAEFAANGFGGGGLDVVVSWCRGGEMEG